MSKNEIPGKNCDNIWKGEEAYLYLSFLDSESICGLGISSTPLDPSLVLHCELFNVIDLFDSKFFIFSSDLTHYKPEWHVSKSSTIVLERDGIRILSSGVAVSEGARLDKSSPLWHLLLISKNLNKKQKDAFRLAMQRGFPQINVIDFIEGKIRVEKEEIISEWKSLVTNYHDSLERDFVRALASAMKSFEKEYHVLLGKMYLVKTSQDSSNYSLNPLLAILEYTSKIRTRIKDYQPKMYIKSLEFETIFELEEDNVSNFVISLKEELLSDFLDVSVNEISRVTQHDLQILEKKCRVRISIALMGIAQSVDPEDAAQLVNELWHLVVEKALYSTSILQKAFYKVAFSSYELFINHYKQEFWLKRASISIRLPQHMMDIALKVISKNLGNHLDSSKPISIRTSKKGIEVIFNLYLTSGYDYIIDGSRQGYFSEMRSDDPNVNIGLEHLERKEFDKALRSFRSAKKNSRHWTRITTTLRDISILERDIKMDLLTQKERGEKTKEWKSLQHGKEFRIRRRFSQNFFNFLEDVGGFYIEFLQKAKQEFPNLVEEWMDFRI